MRCVMSEFNFSSEVHKLLDSTKRDNPELSESIRIKHAWNATVDQRIANHVTAVFIVPNTHASEVIVYVDDAIWATELGMQTEILRLNLNQHLNQSSDFPTENYEQVEKLTFKPSKEKYISKERRLSTKEILEEEDRIYKEAQPEALSDDELSDLNQMFAQIDNDEIREIAYAAAKANLELKKGIDKIGA